MHFEVNQTIKDKETTMTRSTGLSPSKWD